MIDAGNDPPAATSPKKRSRKAKSDDENAATKTKKKKNDRKKKSDSGTKDNENDDSGKKKSSPKKAADHQRITEIDELPKLWPSEEKAKAGSYSECPIYFLIHHVYECFYFPAVLSRPLTSTETSYPQLDLSFHNCKLECSWATCFGQKGSESVGVVV